MNRRILCVFALGVVALESLPAGAGSWSAPTTIATMTANPNSGVVYGGPLVSIDGSGNMFAALAAVGSPGYPAQDLVQIAAASNGGAWSTPTKLTFPGELQSAPLVSLLSTNQGFSTVLLNTSLGFASSDHISGNAWTPASAIQSGAQRYYSNRAADQLLLNASAGNSIYTNVSITLTAIFRLGSAPWKTSSEVVATGNNATLEAAELAADGSALVVWSTSDHVCTIVRNRKQCKVQNYVRHISTRAVGTAPWVDIGVLPAALAGGVAIYDVQGDATGTVVFLYANPIGGAYSIVYHGGTFSAPAAAFTDYVQNYLGLAPEMRLDGNGHATIVLGVLGLPINNNLPGGNYSIAEVDGNVTTNTWSPLQVISGTDDAGGFVFGLNASGAAVVAYQNNYYVQLPPSIRAVARSTSGRAWSAPVTIDNLFPTYVTSGIDIDPAGQAVIGYTGYHFVGTTSTISDSAVRVFQYKP